MLAFRLGRRAHILVAVVLAASLTGCEIFSSDNEASEVDDRLEATLVDASAGEGLSSFMMPESDDFVAIPQDPRNRLTDAKVELGKLLYHETALAVNPEYPDGRFTYSCASCHHAAAGFQAGRVQGIGEGGMGFGVRGESRDRNPMYEADKMDIQPIRTPTAMNGAYQEVMLWNGQFGGDPSGPNAGTQASWTPGTPKEANNFGYQGLEIQAIAGLAVHRMADIEETIAATNETYTQLFAEAFPGKPIDREHAGLAIAAYERTLLASDAPFQQWLRGEVGAMTEQQKRGALLFFGKAECSTCHAGPALNSMTFHAIGMGDLAGEGVFSEPDPVANRGRGGFTNNPADNYKFKTPQLYNLIDSPFFGHGGTFRSVREVVEYKNRAIPENPAVPQSQLADGFQPLGLTADEVTDLVVFLEEALYDPNLERYVPDTLPSGECFPVNDSAARGDLGC